MAPPPSSSDAIIRVRDITVQFGKTRVLDGVMLGASSRAAIHLMSATKANARLEGRDTVTIEDVRTMAQYVLPHRLIVEDDDVSPADALQIALDSPILAEP